LFNLLRLAGKGIPPKESVNNYKTTTVKVGFFEDQFSQRFYEAVKALPASHGDIAVFSKLLLSKQVAVDLE
jgi:hypothetical protein